MDFKNIILICDETETNLEEEKVFVYFQKLKEIINKYFKGLKMSNKKSKYKKW